MTTIPPTPSEVELMGLALGEAGTAGSLGEIPVGAVLVDSTGRVLGVGRNSCMVDRDPTAHAELVAIREAARAGDERLLPGSTLVVTLEPCAMCAGAILAARVSRLIFGAWDQKAGAAGSVYDLLRDGRLPHAVPEVIGGVRAEECAALLREFFEQRRPPAREL